MNIEKTAKNNEEIKLDSLNEEFLKTLAKDSKILIVGDEAGTEIESLKKLGFISLTSKKISELISIDNFEYDMVIAYNLFSKIQSENLGDLFKEIYRISRKNIMGIEYIENSGNYAANSPEFSNGQFLKTSNITNKIVHNQEIGVKEDFRKSFLSKYLTMWLLKEKKSIEFHAFLFEKSSMNENKGFVIDTFPRVVRIEPSSLCNLRCCHCPTGNVDMKRGIMEWKTFEKVIEEIKKNIDAVKVIILYHGGEPLLNPNFFKMVEEIKNIGGIEKIKVDTNGMLMNNENIEKLAKSGIDTLFVSLDGQSPEENNKIRRNSDASTVIANVKKLCEKKKEFGSTKPDVFICSIQFFNPDEKNPPAKPIAPEWLVKAFEGFDVKINTYYAYHWPIMNVDESLFKVVKTEEEKLDYCDHVVNTISIRYDGTVVPCCYDLTTGCPMGNILKDSLKDIWNNERYIQLRKSIYNKDYCPMCKNCSTVNQHIYLSLNKKYPQ